LTILGRTLCLLTAPSKVRPPSWPGVRRSDTNTTRRSRRGGEASSGVDQDLTLELPLLLPPPPPRVHWYTMSKQSGNELPGQE